MAQADLRTVQRTLFQALRDRPLDLLDEEDRKLYEPLHDDDHDPVKRLFGGQSEQACTRRGKW